jgi:hypothetical protein
MPQDSINLVLNTINRTLGVSMQKAAPNACPVIQPLSFNSAPHQVVIRECKSRVGIAGN